MSEPFDPTLGTICVTAMLTGPAATVELFLALDTGSTASLVSEVLLRAAGLDLSQPAGMAQITSGGGVVSRPMVTALRFAALGATVKDYQIVCHTLPPSAGVDGVLGLDFFTGRVLTIDFTNNTLNLT
jgi:hypothetical protein